jgi:hypothetical protein
MIIHYGLIGKNPAMEVFREELPVVITCHYISGSIQTKSIIESCAAHFYGLSKDDFDNTDDLIDAIQSMDQNLKVS